MTAARPAYPPQGQWTLEAFDALPDDKVKRELVDGELLVSPPGTWPHNMLGSRLAVRLESLAPPRYVVVVDNEILISPTHVRRPDVMVVTAASAEREDYRFPTNEVLLAVEIVSPGSTKMDRKIKPKVYAGAGIPLYWRIETHPTVVHTYTLDPTRMAYWQTGHFDDVIKVDRPWSIELAISEINPPLAR
jgi:Uma2 family endonuclease